MDAETELILQKAKMRLVISHPFFATLLLSMPLQERLDIPTMAVDGTNIYFNPNFVKEIGVECTVGVLAHEVMHPALMHTWRCNGRDPEKWNRAGDYVINGILTEAGLTLPKGGLLDPAYNGMHSEAVYPKLPDNPPADSGTPSRGWNGKDMLPPPGPPKTQQEQQVAEAQMKVRVAQAVAIAQATGTLPGALKRLIDEVLNPKLSWRELLKHYFTAICKDDQSWARGNRRFISAGIYLPSWYSESLELAVCAIDTSGSVWEDAPAFLSEVDAIRRECGVKQLAVLMVDAAVQSVEFFGDHEDARTAQIAGGGGTSFTPAFEWVTAQGLMPNVLVYLTDMQGTFPAEVPDYPVIWAATTDAQPPFGDVIRL